MVDAVGIEPTTCRLRVESRVALKASATRLDINHLQRISPHRHTLKMVQFVQKIRHC